MNITNEVQDALAEVYNGEISRPEAEALVAALFKRGLIIESTSSLLDTPDPEDFVGWVGDEEEVF